jgi:hypothetical protein
MLPVMRLDRHGGAPVPDDYVVVDSEASFLLGVAKNGALQVLGQALCRWAETLCRARSWPFVSVQPVYADLIAHCPGLSAEHARILVEQLGGPNRVLEQPLQTLTLLETLLGQGPWDLRPSPTHAAEWLLWLADAQPMEAARALLDQQAGLWALDASTEAERLAYAVTDGGSAHTLLCTWLCIDGIDTRPAGIGVFPARLPDPWLHKARCSWRTQLADKGIAAVDHLVDAPLPDELREVAADECALWFAAHAPAATRDAIRKIEPYLADDRIRRLRALSPPDDPGLPPTDYADVTRWFRERYLRWRLWQTEHGEVAAANRAKEIGQHFALWYLEFYGAALASGDSLLAPARSRHLADMRRAPEEVLFWVILDGLHLEDAGLIEQAVAKEPRLTLVVSDIVGAALPTVTEFAKEAVIRGLPPVRAREPSAPSLFPGCIDIASNRAPIERLRGAKRGDVFLWRPADPDETYHRSADRANVLSSARAKVRAIAENLVEAALAVPNDLGLAVVITTDHGRLLGGGERSHAVPAGMEAHGRAAWGPSHKAYPASGFLVDEERMEAWLHRDRFGLPTDCAVVLDEDSFLAAGEKRGTAEFAHGGLFPEEILLPWIEVGRDYVPPALLCTLTGTARSGAEGEVSLRVVNPGGVRVSIMSIELRTGQRVQRIEIGQEVGAHNNLDHGFQLDRWPTKADLARASATLSCTLPAGSAFTLSADVQLDSEEYYTRSLDLEDF